MTTAPGTPRLGHCERPLDHTYDLAMLDLDGVVYVGSDAVPGAAGHLAAARGQGLRLAFVTNNASRPPAQVASHLSDLGVPAVAADVVTSAQAAARVLADRLGSTTRVAVLGAAGLLEAVADTGLQATGADDPDALAVVTGYGPDVPWRDVMRAAVRIREGLWWVASNTDLTIPTAYGVAPGHGVQVRMLSEFAGVDPVVAGKPARPLLDETVRRVGGERPLMVGDRLDTDIAGALNADVDSLLVLTGVTGLAELVSAPPQERPTYLATDLGALGRAQPRVELDAGAASVGGWTARVEAGRLVVEGDADSASRGGDAREEAVDDWWRVVAVAAWAHLDDTGRPADHADLEPPG